MTSTQETKRRKTEFAEAAAAATPGSERVNIIAQLEDSEGNPTGPQLDLPHDADPKQLEELLNTLLENEDKVPFAFYAADAEVIGQLGDHLRKRGASVEQVLRIVYQPQALFRVRPVTRCSSAIPGHAEAVLSVAFSPDGKHLASGSGDTTVRLWNHETETPKHTCKGHTNWVLCISWSPDGRVVASGGMDKDVRLWDPITGAALGGAMRGHRKHITALAWEPAHVAYPPVRLASASGDGTVRIWNTVHRNCELALTAHTNSVTSVKWGGEGLLYSASRDTTVFVWDAGDGKVVRQLKGHGHWVNTLALSSEYALRTGPYDHKAVKPDNDDEAKSKALERYKAATGGKPERLVSGSDDFTMFMWTPGTSKQPLSRMTGHVQLINHVLFSPDGRWVASGSFDKAVKLWDGLTVGTGRWGEEGRAGGVYNRLRACLVLSPSAQPPLQPPWPPTTCVLLTAQRSALIPMSAKAAAAASSEKLERSPFRPGCCRSRVTRRRRSLLRFRGVRTLPFGDVRGHHEGARGSRVSDRLVG